MSRCIRRPIEALPRAARREGVALRKGAVVDSRDGNGGGVGRCVRSTEPDAQSARPAALRRQKAVLDTGWEGATTWHGGVRSYSSHCGKRLRYWAMARWWLGVWFGVSWASAAISRSSLPLARRPSTQVWA
jgi:hypothetical protein